MTLALDSSLPTTHNIDMYAIIWNWIEGIFQLILTSLRDWLNDVIFCCYCSLFPFCTQGYLFTEIEDDNDDDDGTESADAAKERLNMFILSRKGGVHLVHNNFVYRSNMKRQGRENNKIYWECIYNRSIKCRGRVKSIGDKLYITNGKLWIALWCISLKENLLNIINSMLFLFWFAVVHNHVEDSRRVEAAKRAGNLMYKAISSLGAVTKFEEDQSTTAVAVTASRLSYSWKQERTY